MSLPDSEPSGAIEYDLTAILTLVRKDVEARGMVRIKSVMSLHEVDVDEFAIIATGEFEHRDTRAEFDRMFGRAADPHEKDRGPFGRD